MLPDWDDRLYGPHKSTWTFFSLFVISIMLLFCLTTWMDLLPIQEI